MPAYKYTQKDGSTKWYANFYYVDWTGERKHKCKRGFKTQREAKEYERNFLNQEKTDTDILFSNFIESYMEDMNSRLKPTTMEGKRYIIEKKLLPYFGKLKIKDITSITVRKWQNEMMAYRNESGKPYSKTYLKTMNNQLSAMLNYAVKHYNLPSNPCRVAGSMGKSKADEMNVWTKEQFDKFIVTFRKPATRLAFNILFYTGIRVGELLALTPADILPDKRIDISKNFARSKGEDLIMTPKTDKSYRSISIPDFLYNEIQQYISSLYEIRPEDRIFYFTKSNMEHEIKRGAARAGIPIIRVHDLRHSHASMLIDMGFDILEISRRLGHESTQTTWDTYSHIYPDKDKKLADDLNKLYRKDERMDKQNFCNQVISEYEDFISTKKLFTEVSLDGLNEAEEYKNKAYELRGKLISAKSLLKDNSIVEPNYNARIEEIDSAIANISNVIDDIVKYLRKTP